MRKNHLILKFSVIVVLGINLQACSSVQQMIQGTPTFTPTFTPTLTLTPSPTPTSTSTPTKTPTPTATPNLVATQQYVDFFIWVEKFFNEGFIPSVQGEYHALEDYSNSFAKSGYYTWVTYDALKTTNFIMQANVKITNATTQNLSKAACGFVFEDFFANRAAFFALDGNAIFRTDGRDRGSNYLDPALYDNPDGVKITLLLYDGDMHFFVNDRKGLSQINVGAGPYAVGPSVLSGTNEGFGTRCDFTDIVLWIIE